MARIDSGSKSSRLLASRRYTHDTYTTAQEAFTNVLDLRSEEIFTQAHHITASNLPYSGSSQHGSTLSVGGNEIKKYWYRHKLTPSNVTDEKSICSGSSNTLNWNPLISPVLSIQLLNVLSSIFIKTI